MRMIAASAEAQCPRSRSAFPRSACSWAQPRGAVARAGTHDAPSLAASIHSSAASTVTRVEVSRRFSRSSSESPAGQQKGVESATTDPDGNAITLIGNSASSTRVKTVGGGERRAGLFSSEATADRLALMVDFRLELVQVPVSDVDRAKAFYSEKVGFVADHDYQVSDDIRFVQLTPPGSACSIALGTGLSNMQPGSVQGFQLVVDDIEAARAELAERGVEVSEVQEFPGAHSSSSLTPTGTAGQYSRCRPPRSCRSSLRFDARADVDPLRLLDLLSVLGLDRPELLEARD